MHNNDYANSPDTTDGLVYNVGYCSSPVTIAAKNIIPNVSFYSSSSTSNKTDLESPISDGYQYANNGALMYTYQNQNITLSKTYLDGGSDIVIPAAKNIISYSMKFQKSFSGIDSKITYPYLSKGTYNPNIIDYLSSNNMLNRVGLYFLDKNAESVNYTMPYLTDSDQNANVLDNNISYLLPGIFDVLLTKDEANDLYQKGCNISFDKKMSNNIKKVNYNKDITNTYQVECSKNSTLGNGKEVGYYQAKHAPIDNTPQYNQKEIDCIIQKSFNSVMGLPLDPDCQAILAEANTAQSTTTPTTPTDSTPDSFIVENQFQYFITETFGTGNLFDGSHEVYYGGWVTTDLTNDQLLNIPDMCRANIGKSPFKDSNQIVNFDSTSYVGIGYLANPPASGTAYFSCSAGSCSVTSSPLNGGIYQ